MTARRLLPFALLGCGLMACLLATGPARAVEPYEQFREGLKAKGLFDMAIEYLALMKDSPVLTADQKAVLPYEEALIYMGWARQERDLNQKNGLLDKAAERLQAFIQGNSAHPRTADAEMELGNVLVERGIALVETAARPNNAAQAETMLAEARKKFESALEVFTTARDRFAEQLKQFPKFIPNTDQAQVQARDKTRENLIRSQLLHAATTHEIARTYKTGSDQYKQQLLAAADAYEKIYEDYRTYVVGLRARLKQAQCFQDVGDIKRALGLYANLVDQPADLPDLRTLRASAMYLMLECWTLESQGEYELALTKGEEFLLPVNTREDEAVQGEWLAARYFTALAYKRQADRLTEKTQTEQKRQLLDKAQEHATFVAKYNGAYQDAGKSLLRQMLGAEGDDDTREARTFAEAKTRGESAQQEMATRVAELQAAQASGDQNKIIAANEAMAAARDRALRHFRRALALKDDNSPLDDVNIVRYYLCYLDYTAGRYYDAAVMGNYIVTYYPSSPGARQCATLAMGAFVQEYNSPQATDASRAFDRGELERLAALYEKRWPGEAEAVQCYFILLAIAENEKNYANVLDYLAKVPEGSAKRGEAELIAGRSLWGGYVAQSNLTGVDKPDPAKLAALAADAQKQFEAGLARFKAGIKKPEEASALVADSALRLANAYVNLGQADKAVALLTDPVIGPLALIAAKAPGTGPAAGSTQPTYAIEANKLALRAYVATQALDKAEATMDALEKLVASGDSSGKAGAELTRIYIALGADLETQLKSLRAAGEAEQAAQVSKGFELFLDKISQAADVDFRSLNWVADTFYNLGNAYLGSDGSVTEQARAYYQKSTATDEKILARGASDTAFAQLDYLLAVKMRLAKVKRSTGDYEGALKLLLDVIKAKPQLLDAQKEAALTLEAWGKQDPSKYALAIVGTETIQTPQGAQNVIWGWSKLSIQTQSQANFTRDYHMARLHLATCRLAQARAATDSAEKDKLLKSAHFDIVITLRFKPDLGGDEFRPQYDALLKEIQRASGERSPKGLQALETPGVPAAAGTTGG